VSYKYIDYRFLKKVALNSIYFKKNYFRKKTQLTMKKAILLFLTLIYFTNYAQTKFEKGYFINNSGERIECYIEILDLFYTPTMFNYKISKETEKIKVSINEVKIFEIYDVVKYERYNVNIDRSSKIIDEISANRKAIFNEEQLFLKVLVNGKASLFQYSEPNLNRFFFKKDNSKIEQLVFKTYRDGFDYVIKKNERYKQQLLNSLKCKNSLNIKKIKDLSYKKNKLSKLFIEYNRCKGVNYEDYSLEKKKSLKSQFNLSLKAGTRLIDFSVDSSVFFESKLTARVSIESELVLPINNNKWSLVVEPNYVYYNSKYNDLKSNNSADNNDNFSKINYSAIDLPLGIRYYLLFNNKNFKFYINAFVVTNFIISLQTEPNDENSRIFANEGKKFSFNRSFGIGYKYKNKLSIEYRVLGGTRKLLNLDNGKDFILFNSIIFGYTLF
jgi:hypothetical protein